MRLQCKAWRQSAFEESCTIFHQTISSSKIQDRSETFHDDHSKDGTDLLATGALANRCVSTMGPLSADDWDGQMMFFPTRIPVSHHDRCDKAPTQTVTGNEMNTYAADAGRKA
jgi:hypothetical protein